MNGNGLSSSGAQNNTDTTLELVDNAILGLTQFSGEPVDANSILIKHTYYGDIDLNGAVDADDLTVLANNFGRTSGASHVDGDIDFNGTVDADDLTVFANNFLKGVGAPLVAGGVKDKVQRTKDERGPSVVLARSPDRANLSTDGLPAVFEQEFETFGQSSVRGQETRAQQESLAQHEAEDDDALVDLLAREIAQSVVISTGESVADARLAIARRGPFHALA